MPVFALLIISKAGSLIYHRTFPTTTTATTTTTPGLGTNPTPVPPSTGSLGLPGTSALTTNDYLVLAGTFHGVHAIARSITPRLPATAAAPLDQRPSTPQQQQQQQQQSQQQSQQQKIHPHSSWTYPDPSVPPSGIESLESSFFRLTVHQTATGTKFLLFTDPSMSPASTETVIKGVYERYADHVCKNPFWQMEMPIRLEGWDREVGKWLAVRR